MRPAASAVPHCLLSVVDAYGVVVVGGALMGGAATAAVGMMAVAATAATTAEAAEAELEHGPSQRAFRLCVEARAFRAKKLPIAVAKIYVKLKLPPELEGASHSLLTRPQVASLCVQLVCVCSRSLFSSQPVNTLSSQQLKAACCSFTKGEFGLLSVHTWCTRTLRRLSNETRRFVVAGVRTATDVIVSEGGKPPVSFVRPHRTHPPVEVVKGSEVRLDNGFCEVHFSAAVLTLATALTAGPRVLAEVWLMDRHAADSLLGVASVGLAPLLSEPYLVRGLHPLPDNALLPL